MKRTKPVAAIDLDDVVIETGNRILTHYAQTYGVVVPPRLLYSAEPAVWGVSERQMIHDRVDGYLASAAFTAEPPAIQSLHALQKLSRIYELHIITGRPRHLAAATQTLLDQYFNGIFRSVTYTHVFGDSSLTKLDACRAIGASVLIDDHARHIKAVTAGGVDAILFGDYAWNEAETLPPQTTRAANWDEILALLYARRGHST